MALATRQVQLLYGKFSNHVNCDRGATFMGLMADVGLANTLIVDVNLRYFGNGKNVRKSCRNSSSKP